MSRIPADLLTGLTETDGYAWFKNTKLDFAGTGSTQGITYLGFNLFFMPIQPPMKESNPSWEPIPCKRHCCLMCGNYSVSHFD